MSFRISSNVICDRGGSENQRFDICSIQVHQGMSRILFGRVQTWMINMRRLPTISIADGILHFVAAGESLNGSETMQFFFVYCYSIGFYVTEVRVSTSRSSPLNVGTKSYPPVHHTEKQSHFPVSLKSTLKPQQSLGVVAELIA